jgi:hypothetical protein
MTPAIRKFALTVHVVASVGWLGAVAVALALGLVGAVSEDAQRVASAYIALELVGWVVLVPLSVASLLSGLVQALGTPWGLVRHYWVVIKLVINLVASVVLLLYMQTLGGLADVASENLSAPERLDDLRSFSPVLHAGAALLLLVVASVLAVYKPRGQTGYGWRRTRDTP